MNKLELASAIAEKSGVTKEVAKTVLNNTLETITEALANGDSVQIVGFGNFSVKKRSAHKGVNPKTKESIDIPESYVPTFKAGKPMKDAVKK